MSTLNVDTILEQTSGGGVTVDGVLLKDGVVTGTPKISGAAADSLLKIDGSEQIVPITKSALITLLQLAATDIVSGTFADARIAESNITQHVAALVHQSLSGAGSNTHAQIDTHIANTSNPHSVTKSQIGLGNVDNTADADKPVSTAQAAADALRLLATGATTGATSQAQDFTNGLTIAGGSNGINASGALTAAGATFDNNADSTFDINLDSGSTTAQLTRLNFRDRGTAQFQIVKDNTGLFLLYDSINATPVFYGDSTGITIGSFTRAAQLHVVNGTASQPAFIARAHGSQADNIIEIQTSGGAIQFGIGVSGQILTNQDSANTNTPIGATAHQLPIYNEAGTLLGYIPVYASAW